MLNEPTNSNLETESENISERPIPMTEGHQPQELFKGHKPTSRSEIFTGGYKPDISNLNSQNPPQGGSGVPQPSLSPQKKDRADNDSGEHK